MGWRDIPRNVPSGNAESKENINMEENPMTKEMTKEQRDNRSNQMNPNNWRYDKVRNPGAERKPTPGQLTKERRDSHQRQYCINKAS